MEEKQSTLFVLSIAVALSIVLGECSPAPTLSEAMSATPETVVESFYNWYVGCPGNSLVDGAYRSSEYLTPEFVQKVDEIVASFDEGGYDPFLCAQDIPGELTVEKAVASGEGASVVVHEIWNPGTQYELIHDVTVALRLVDGQWKISDIICPKVGAGEAEGRRQPDVFKFQGSYLTGMAYGFYELRVNGRQLLTHAGDMLFFCSQLYLLPHEEVGLYVVYNAPGGRLARKELVQAYFDHFYPAAPNTVPQPPASATERNGQLAGRYISTRSAQTTIEKLRLLVEPMYQPITVGATRDGYLESDHPVVRRQNPASYQPSR